MRRVQSAICSERRRAIRHGSRAGAWRRNERRRSSAARDDDGGGFRARSAASEGEQSDTDRAPAHGGGMSGGVLPLRGTTTAAGSERDLQRAKASNQTRIARRRMEEE